MSTNTLQERPTNPKFTLISDKHRILRQIMTAIQRAENTISIIFSKHKVLHFISLFGDILIDAQKRGVVIHIITEFTTKHEHARMIRGVRYASSGLNIRYFDRPLVHCILVDDKELMLATSTNVSIGDHPKLWTTDEDLLVDFNSTMRRY